MKGGKKKMNYIGMDIHKQFTVAVVKDKEGNQLAEEKFDNSKDNFANFLGEYEPKETKIVMESTMVWEWIYEIIESLGYDVKLANPLKTKAIAFARIKTDKIDANILADLLRTNLIAESYIPPKETRVLRELTRERKTIVKQQTQLKNKIRALLIRRGEVLPTVTFSIIAFSWLDEKGGIIAQYTRLLRDYQAELEIIDDRIHEISDRLDETKLLCTVPGIGSIRALTIVSEIGEIERFQTSGHLCSFAGLVPSVRQSGNTLVHGRLIKQASKILKYVLIETSWSIVKSKQSTPLKEFYKKLMKKKGKQKAICATARKLCCTIHAMLRKQQPFMLL